MARGGKLESAVGILSSANAHALKLSGSEAFADLTTEGGHLGAIRAIAADAAADVIAVVDVAKLLVASEDDVRVTTARHASLEMLDNPTNNSGTPAPTTLVSLWQTNAAGVMAERVVNYTAMGAVAYLSGSYLEGIGSR